MQQEERLRALIREDLERGPVPETALGPVVERVRRRRAARRVLYGLVAVAMATAVALPLTLLGFLGRGSRIPGTPVESYGIHVVLPRGWEGRFYLSPGRGPVLIAANYSFRLPESGHRLVPFSPFLPQGGGNDAAAIALFEYPPDRMSPSDGSFPALRGDVRISAADIKPCALMKDGCVIRYLSIAGRNFLLLGSFATLDGRAAGSIAVGGVRVVPRKVLAEASGLLETLAVDRSGYRLGLSCSPHGTSLQLTTSTRGVVGWSPSCWAAPSGQELTIHFQNRLTTVNGKAGISANVELYPNEVFAYTVEDQSYGSGPNDRQHALFIGGEVISPRSITYRVPPLAPGVYFLTSGSGLGLNGLSGVLIVTD